MSVDLNELQAQVKILAVSVEAQKMLTEEAIKRAGDNAGTLRELTLQIEMMSKSQLTQANVSAMLDNSVNAAIVSGFKKVGWAIVLSAIGAVIAFIQIPFNHK